MIANRIRYCLTFCGVEYIFRNKKLLKQPYFRNKRTQNEKIIKPKANGYLLQGLYMSNESIKKILVKKEVQEYIEDLTPF